MSDFTVFPAIDIRQGRVVRLVQGDAARETVYAADPAATARRWLDAGAAWLHVVNLDGALEQPDALNRRALADILAQTQGRARVQFGGGMRSLPAAALALEMGVSRVVLGTLAAQDPASLQLLLRRFGPAAVAVGVDARGGRVQVSGWTRATEQDVLPFCLGLKQLGVETVIYTDIARDGLETGVDVDTARQIASLCQLEVIASGGVAGLPDIRSARQAGLAGVIVGRALYEGRFQLAEALLC